MSRTTNSTFSTVINRCVSRDATPYWAMFVLALALRAAHQYIMSRQDPMYGFLLTGGDNHTYDRWASEISQTFWLGWDRIPFFHGPLYPYVLGMVYLRFGHSHDAAAWMQRLLGALTVVLIFYLARRVFGKRAGWFAGLGAAGCPLFLLYEGEILADTLILFLYVATLCIVLEARARKTWLWWMLSGVAVGLCSLGRPNALLFVPAVACWLLCIVPGSLARRVAFVTLFSGAALATIAPSAILNITVGGYPALVTYSGAFNAYIGNAPDATGVFWSPPSMQEIRKTEGKEDIDIDWRGHLLTALREDPGLLPRKLALKTKLFWQSGELPHNINYYLKRPFSPFLMLPLRWAVVAPLGLIGLVLALMGMPKTLDDDRIALAAFVALYAASIILVFVLSRLRLPALAVLFVFAGYALAVVSVCIQDALRNTNARSALFKAGVIVLVWVITAFALQTRDDTLLMRWNDHFNLGSAYESARRYPEALSQYEQALARAPELRVLQEICDTVRQRVQQGEGP